MEQRTEGSCVVYRLSQLETQRLKEMLANAEEEHLVLEITDCGMGYGVRAHICGNNSGWHPPLINITDYDSW